MKYDYRKVEQYLNPTRTTEQEAELQTDNSLREEVTFYRDLSKVVNWSASMKEAQAELSATQTGGAQVRRMGFRRSLSYAASFLVLFSCGTFWYASNSYSNTALADLNTKKLNLYDSSVVRSADVETSTFRNAALALEANNAQEAWGIMQAVDDNTASTQLLKAYIAYELENFDDAQERAESVRNLKESQIIIQKAEWLIVQSELAMSTESEDLNSLLHKIAKDDTHLFQKEALELEKSLNSFWRRFLL